MRDSLERIEHDPAETYSIEHDPDGYACNMGWRVVDSNGREVKRGPEWACRVFVIGGEIRSPLRFGVLPRTLRKDS